MLNLLKLVSNNIIIMLRYGDKVRDINNKKGFTLIELLAVIVILGVIMTVAIPNVVSTLDKNKRNSFLKDAKRAITSVEYTIRSNPIYDWPDNNTVVVFPLNKIKNLDIKTSSFDTEYSLKDSFVAITKQAVNDGTDDMDYKYYIHLVSCKSISCGYGDGNVVTDADTILDNRGINLTERSELDGVNRYDLVKRGTDVNVLLFRDPHKVYTEIKNLLNRTNIVVY